MKKSFIVHPIKLGVSAATAFVTGMLAITAFRAHSVIAGAVFLVIALVFLALIAVFGAAITIDGEGVSRRFFGFVTRSMKWSEVAEIGVAGSKVLKKPDSDRTGELYIYFSPRSLNDQARFEMMLNWPPKEQLFMYYTQNRVKAVMFCTDKKIEKYNTGKLKIDNKSMK